MFDLYNLTLDQLHRQPIQRAAEHARLLRQLDPAASLLKAAGLPLTGRLSLHKGKQLNQHPSPLSEPAYTATLFIRL